MRTTAMVGYGFARYSRLDGVDAVDGVDRVDAVEEVFRRLLAKVAGDGASVLNLGAQGAGCACQNSLEMSPL
jgi:hypothetical protein